MRIKKKKLTEIIESAFLGRLKNPEAEESKRDELATQVRNATSDLYNSKDMYDLEGKSIEELEDLLYDLGNSQEQHAIDDMYRDEEEDAMGRVGDLSKAELSPRRQGMSRRPAGSKSQRRMESKMKIKKTALVKLIREALEASDYNVQSAISRAAERGHSEDEIQGVLNSYSLDEEIITMLDKLGSETYPAALAKEE